MNKVCLIDKKKYILDINRSHLNLILNDTHKIKIGWFDVKICKLVYNNIYLKLYNEESYILEQYNQNNIKSIYLEIDKSIKNLFFDLKVGELIINNQDIEDDSECCICFESNKNDEEIVQLKCCNNVLHLECLIQHWKSNYTYKCPLCRDTKCLFCFGECSIV